MGVLLSASVGTGINLGTFAKRYGFSLGAVRDWEQGRYEPDPSTRAYLKVIKAMPDEVARALEREAAKTASCADAVNLYSYAVES